MKRILFFFLTINCTLLVRSQGTFPYNGVQDIRDVSYAFVHATIIPRAGEHLDNATLLVKNGLILDLGTDIEIPENAVVFDLSGKYIYPSFVDLWSDYGMPQQSKKRNKPRRGHGRPGPQPLSNKKGAFGWNQAIKPEIRGEELFHTDTAKAGRYRKMGFGTVLTHVQDGIMRGTGSMVLLANQRDNQNLIIPEAGAFFSFDKGSSTQNYPSSLMGSIALLRQTFYDAQWYEKASQLPGSERNLSLEALLRIMDLPAFFSVKDKYSLLRADKIGDEFGIRFIIKGAGDAYQLADAVKKADVPMILPLTFPKPYDVSDPYDADLVSLAQMKHWEMAPANPALLSREGITFALTSAGIQSAGEFWKNLRKAVHYGLDPDLALRALTEIPASLARAGQYVGTLEKGKYANFLITSGNIFNQDILIYENWVRGQRYVINDMNLAGLSGPYELTVAEQEPVQFELKMKKNRLHATLTKPDTLKWKIKVRVSGTLVNLTVDQGEGQTHHYLRLSGWIKGNEWAGTGSGPDGETFSWTARQLSVADLSGKPDESPPPTLGAVLHPFVAHGWTEPPKPETILFKNATVWTNEEEGIVEHTDVLVSGGKIQAVGQNLDAPGARVIDATGLHLTSGIIDEHSHVGIAGGVNEGTQASSAEVRIKDVIDPSNINIYRALAGGVTALHALHGSANPVGGQTQLIKLRWGRLPDEMIFSQAPPFIKFALGENVKQSNWGDQFTQRYPQTRMGVEQVYTDLFTRAREYEKAWQAYNNLPRKEKEKAIPPRKDLELEALLEVLNGQRFITCHSYVQSEINMLIKVAERFGFRVNTFTHILEGYKVADKIKAHGAGASSFSDWWAYKYEVIEAIPYNPSILDKVGVITAVNSDDAEMGRRLNQEAAKAMKYGGLSREEAWKLVTLNPAKLMHVDQYTGSIRPGKDADLVLWSDDPLSVYAIPLMTLVDGIVYFDREREKQMEEYIRAERQRLINKMLAELAKGTPGQKPKPLFHPEYHCNDIESDFTW